MSKPIVRVTVFVLISLVLIAATSVGVRGWLSSAHQATGTHLVSGMYTNFNHQRSTSAELQNGPSAQPSGAHQGGCHSNSPNSSQY